jgi:hypothetical protein
MIIRRLHGGIGTTPAILLALMLGLALATIAPTAGAPTTLATLYGAGLLDSLACVACVAVIVFAGGGTPLGVLAVAGAYPTAVAGCLATCVIAAT